MKQDNMHDDLMDPALIDFEVLQDCQYYTEGPAVDEFGRLYYTDLVGKHIWQHRDGVSAKWGRGLKPNGQRILDDGSHLICDSAAKCVTQYNQAGEKIAQYGLGEIDGIPVTCPNDLCIFPGHGFYFTDSIRHQGYVFYIGFDGSSEVICDGLDFPNGIALSSDKKRLLVAESYTNRILSLDVDNLGYQPRRPQVFATLPENPLNSETGNLPDGIAFDESGRLWVAHYGMQAVHVLSKKGELITSYDTGIPLTSNLCFVENHLVVTGGFAEPGPGRVTRLAVFK